MIARLICLIAGHRTKVVYTATEGLVQCQRCEHTFDRWPVIRPEDRHREQRRTADFWAKVDEPKVTPLRRVK